MNLDNEIPFAKEANAQDRFDPLALRGAIVNIADEPREFRYAISDKLLRIGCELRRLKDDHRIPYSQAGIRLAIECLDDVTEGIFDEEDAMKNLVESLTYQIDFLRKDFDSLKGVASKIATESEIQKRSDAAEIARLKAIIERRQIEHNPASPGLRANVLALTGGKCAYCDAEITSDSSDGNANFVIEHVVPKSCGGPDHFANYVPACSKCNAQKSAGHVLEFIQRRLVGARVELAEAAE